MELLVFSEAICLWRVFWNISVKWKFNGLTVVTMLSGCSRLCFLVSFFLRTNVPLSMKFRCCCCFSLCVMFHGLWCLHGNRVCDEWLRSDTLKRKKNRGNMWFFVGCISNIVLVVIFHVEIALKWQIKYFLFNTDWERMKTYDLVGYFGL